MEEKRQRMGLSEAPAELTWDATPPTPPPILQPEPAPEPEPEPPPTGPLIRQHGTEAMARFYKKRLSPSGHTPRVARPGLRMEPIAHQVQIDADVRKSSSTFRKITGKLSFFC